MRAGRVAMLLLALALSPAAADPLVLGEGRMGKKDSERSAGAFHLRSDHQDREALGATLPLSPVRAMCRAAVLTRFFAPQACEPCLVIEELTPREHDAAVVHACARR